MFPNSEVVMLPLIVNDVQRAISQNLDFVALPAALTLPDICAHVDTGKEKVGRIDYERWCDEYVVPYFQTPDALVGLSGVKPIPMTGQLIYTARCAVLHEGMPKTNVLVRTEVNGKKKDVPCLNDVLVFRTSSKKHPFVHVSNMGNAGMCRTREIEIYQLCSALCDAAMSYYGSHADRFKKCSIFDPDKCDFGGASNG